MGRAIEEISTQKESGLYPQTGQTLYNRKKKENYGFPKFSKKSKRRARRSPESRLLKADKNMEENSALESESLTGTMCKLWLFVIKLILILLLLLFAVIKYSILLVLAITLILLYMLLCLLIISGSIEEQVLKGKELLHISWRILSNAVKKTVRGSRTEIPLKQSSTEEDRTVTRQLRNFIYRTCQQNKIDSIVISQSTLDWKNILVIGDRVTSIRQKLSQEISLRKEFEHFTVETEDQESQIENIQYGANHSKLTVNKYKTTGGNWTNDDSLTGELLVSAIDKSPNSNGRQATYLVVAAHLLLMKAEREKGASADNSYIRQSFDGDTQLISQIRALVESRSSKTKYCVSVGGESAFLDTQHPVLFCYRHWYHHLRNSGNSDWWETSCPHKKCPPGSNSLCPHLMMNDVALLQISPDEAAILDRKLNSASCRVTNHVQLLSCPDDVEELHTRTSIIVKGLEGITCETPDQRKPGQALGQHITFTLTCDCPLTCDSQKIIKVKVSALKGNSKLWPGDCGSIVHLKHSNGSLVPLGLFVGEWRLNTTRTGHRGPFYQAIILSQAFKDLETDYPHLLENIRSFSAV